MRQQRGNVGIIILVVVLLALGGVIFQKYYSGLRNPPTISPTPSVSSEFGDWATYTNKLLGYQIRYPKEYVVKDNLFAVKENDDGSVILSNKDDVGESISVVKDRKSDGFSQDTAKLSFDQFASNYVIENHQPQSMECKGVVNQKQVITKNNLKGIVYYLNCGEIVYENSVKYIRNDFVKGPILYLDISEQTKNSAYKARMLEFNSNVYGGEEPLDEKTLLRIADSIVFNPNYTANYVPTDWKAFVSTAGNYSIQYPTSLSLQENQVSSVDGVKVNSQNTIELLPAGLTIKFKATNQSLNDYLRDNSQCTDIEPQKGKPYTLSGIQGLIFENVNCGPWGLTEIDVLNKEVIYTIGIVNYDETARQIISTFKFTN